MTTPSVPIPLAPLRVEDYLDIQAPDVIRIKGHRIGIEHLVRYYQEGYSPEQIADTFPGLALEVVYAVLAYYLRHRAEIDAYIARLESEAETARREWAAHRSPASLQVEAILKERRERSGRP